MVMIASMPKPPALAMTWSEMCFAVIAGLVVEGIAAIGGAEDSPAAGEDSTYIREGEFARTFRPDEAVEAIGNTDHFPFVFEYGGFHGGTDHRVEAGRVAAPVQMPIQRISVIAAR